MDVLIRRATLEDAAGIVAVLNPIIEAGIYSALDTPLRIEEQQAYMRGLSDRDIFHVALEPHSHAIIGLQDVTAFATYTHAFDHVGVIGTFVDLRWSRQGVARSLFRVTFEAARRNGYENAYSGRS